MELFNKLESEYGLPSGLLQAVMQQESGGRKDAISPKGAMGYFQFMPETAKQYNVDPHDLTSSATGAAKYFSDLLKQFNGDLPSALAGYNWGQNRVSKLGFDKIPEETRTYIAKVTSNMQPNNDLEELKALRRLAELEDKAKGYSEDQQKQPEQKKEIKQQKQINIPNDLISKAAQEAGKTVLSGIGGLGEAALSIGTGMGASAYGGLKGLTSLLSGEGVNTAANQITDAQKNYTYQPKTDAGKLATNLAGLPIEYGSKGMGYLGGKVGGLFGEQGRIAGESLGETSVPIAATLLGGRGAIKAGSTTTLGDIFKPVTNVNIPVISDILRGTRDVVRTYTPTGKTKIATEYLQGLTNPVEAPKIISGLERRNKPIVPNSPITSADAIARANREIELKGGADRFGGQYVALQEGLSKVPETSATLINPRILQEQARATILNKGAGTDSSYAAQEAVRSSNAQNLYGQLESSKAIVDASPTVNLINNIVHSKPGITQLRTTMDEVKSSLYDDSGNLRTNPGHLQSSIENINSLLSKQENSAIRKQLMAVKESLTNQINKVEPLQGKASAQYNIDSIPLDKMDLWRVMRDKFISPTGKEAPGSYLRSLRDETKLIKEATGFKRGTDVKDIFNSNESALAARLAAEMEMELLKKRMAGEINLPGIGHAAEGIEPRLPNMLMRETMIANFLLRHLAKNANVDVNIAAANILKDPIQLAGVLKQVKPIHRVNVLKAIKDAAFNTNTALIGSVQAQQGTEQ